MIPSKRPLTDADANVSEQTGRKKARTTAAIRSVVPRANVPVGLIWDNTNFSCAYDALFGIICHIWLDNILVRTAQFKAISPDLYNLAKGFDSVLRGNSTLEAVRDSVRRDLNHRSPDDFPYGQRNISVDQLATSILSDRIYGVATTRCERCGYSVAPCVGDAFTAHISGPSSTSRWLKEYLKRKVHNCPSCLTEDSKRRVRMTRATTLTSVPTLLFAVLGDERISIDLSVKMRCNDKDAIFKLRGVIYHGLNHFTSRIVTTSGVMWFHDGITTGSTTTCHGRVRDFLSPADLHFCQGKKAVAAVYAVQ
ncbi:hypothetical protein B0H11DRAFT_1723950 [Mycena galericulata]|nr:hypothetical protein B0H11DRAFT_1723950 [Mycena galericulata]